MPDPSEQALPFSEAAREAAQQAIIAAVDKRLAFNVVAYGAAWTGETADTGFVCTDAAKEALAAAVDADPRFKRLAALAALADEELVERVARAQQAEWEREGTAHDRQPPTPWDELDDPARAAWRHWARVALAALGLPVAAPCRACGGRGWHTAGGNDPAACNCPAGEAWAGQETTG